MDSPDPVEAKLNFSTRVCKPLGVSHAGAQAMQAK